MLVDSVITADNILTDTQDITKKDCLQWSQKDLEEFK